MDESYELFEQDEYCDVEGHPLPSCQTPVIQGYSATTLLYPGHVFSSDDVLRTDDRTIIEQREDEVERATSTYGLSLVVFTVALLLAVAFISVPLCEGDRFNWPALQFGLGLFWTVPATIAAITWLYASCPTQAWFCGLCSVCSCLSSPMFWVIRYLVTGTFTIENATTSPTSVLYESVQCCSLLVFVVVPYYLFAERYPDSLTQPGSRASYAVLVVLFWILDYTVLISFLHYVQAHQSESNQQMKFALVGSFMATSQITKFIGKRLGVLIDRTKTGTFSIYFSLEFTCTLFYYTFYRTLFDSIHSPFEFVGLVAMHTVQEWTLNVFLASQYAFNIYRSLYEAMHGCPWMQQLLSSWLPPGCASLRDMQSYSATEVGMNSSASVFASLGFVIIICMTNYGWSKQQLMLPAALSSINEHAMVLNLVYIVAATVAEAVSTSMMQYFFFRKHNLSIMVWSQRTLDQPGTFFNVLCVSFCLLINVIYPLIDYECRGS